MRSYHPVFIIIALCSAVSVEAAQLLPVKITGLDKTLELEVRSVIDLPESSSKGIEVSEGRLVYYINSLNALVEDSLEPHGYYHAKVSNSMVRNGQDVQITIDIDLGEPIRVRQQNLKIDGPGNKDRFMGFWLEAFEPKTGDIFNHDTYETNKAIISQALLDRGYFDQKNSTHEVRVTRAENSADINLVWDSGIRYRYGAVRFDGNHLEPGLIEQLINFEQGKYYSQPQIMRFQESLSKLNYFGTIEIVPDLENKDGDQVPIVVTLTEGKQNSYNTSLSYGTKSGFGVEFGLERRWINQKGHKFDFVSDWSQKEQSMIASYRIPAFTWLDGWYGLSLEVRNEDYQTLPTRYVEASVNRFGEVRNWDLLASVNVRHERFDEFIPDSDNAPPINLYTTVVYPEFNAVWRSSRDIAFIPNGTAWTYQGRFGYEVQTADAWFAQAYVNHRRVISLTNKNRILLRADLGAIWTQNYEFFPPSLRFYAGGDQSIRGYGFKEIGEYIDGVNYGGQYLGLGSFEYEHRILPDWAIATFVDFGDAFTQDFNLNVGAGIGARWKSPIGPVRLDVAYGFNGPDPGIAFHFTLGSDL